MLLAYADKLVWIVKLALRRPYTFVVMAILMLVLGVTAIFSMPTDIPLHLRNFAVSDHRFHAKAITDFI
jgi:hypothetical protein